MTSRTEQEKLIKGTLQQVDYFMANSTENSNTTVSAKSTDEESATQTHKKSKRKSIEREKRYTAVASVTKSKTKDALTPIISANENVADTAVKEESSDWISINQYSVSDLVESLSNAPASPSASDVRQRERSYCC
jgi:predicted ABC-class ATPase